MSEIFVSRLKSFAWRAGIALGTFTLAWLSENIGLLELPLWIQGFIALGLSEVSKWWNNKMALQGKTFLGRVL